MVENINSGGLGLGINVDVANTAFWTGGISLFQMLKELLAGESRALLGSKYLFDPFVFLVLSGALVPIFWNSCGLSMCQVLVTNV